MKKITYTCVTASLPMSDDFPESDSCIFCYTHDPARSLPRKDRGLVITRKKYNLANVRRPISGLSGNAFVSRSGGPKFKFWAGRIGRSVANCLQLL